MRDNLKILLQKLLNHNVDFVLAGGLACTVHGSPLVTQDIDICVAINDTQLLKLREVLWDVTRPKGWLLSARFRLCRLQHNYPGFNYS